MGMSFIVGRRRAAPGGNCAGWPENSSLCPLVDAVGARDLSGKDLWL
jgi:hypothetical protein